MTAPAQPQPPRRGLGARLAGESLVYGLGGVANQAVAVLLVPIYARQLGPEGVGITGVLNSTISLSLMLAGLALPNAFFRWYLREAQTDHARADVLSTTLAIRIAASAASLALVLLAAIPVSGGARHRPAGRSPVRSAGTPARVPRSCRRTPGAPR